MFKIFTFSKVSVLIISSHVQDNLLDTHQWFEVGELFWQFVSVVQTHEMAEGWSLWILTLKPFALLFWTYICISTRYVVKSSIFLNHKHDDVIKWKYFPRYLPFVREIHRSPVNSPHIGQWRGALMFPLICACINCWANSLEAGDLRRHRAHYDVIAMKLPWPHLSQMRADVVSEATECF